MKNMKPFLVAGIAAAIVLVAELVDAADYDLSKGIDMTGLTSITASQLNQLVDNGTIASNKGILLYTNSTPDTAGNPRFTRFIWMNTSYDPPQPFVYKTNGAYWTNISAISSIASGSVIAGTIAANAVFTTNIVDNAITDVKILNGAVTSSKIANGSVSNVHLADLTITGAKIANDAILTANIADSQVTSNKLAPGAITASALATNFTLYGTNIGTATITTTNLAVGAVYVTNMSANGGVAYQVQRVNAGATAMEWQGGGVLQIVNVTIGTVVNCNTVTPFDNTVPAITRGNEVLTTSFTPKSANSKLRITFNVYGSIAGGVDRAATAAIHIDGAAAIYAIPNTRAGSAGVLVGSYIMTAGSTTAKTIALRIGPSADSFYVNGDTTGAQLYGGTCLSSMTIEEIY